MLPVPMRPGDARHHTVVARAVKLVLNKSAQKRVVRLGTASALRGDDEDAASQ